MKKLQVKFDFVKTITDWNPQEGASMSSRDGDASYLDVTFPIDSKADVKQKLVSHLENHGFPTDYLALNDNGTICFNVIENVHCNILDKAEQDYTHAIGESLFLCDYNVGFEIREVYTVETEELEELFPGAEKLY